MDSISKKITSRPSLSKVILVIREKIVCFKEGKKLFNDDGLRFRVVFEWRGRRLAKVLGDKFGHKPKGVSQPGRK